MELGPNIEPKPFDGVELEEGLLDVEPLLGCLTGVDPKELGEPKPVNCAE